MSWIVVSMTMILNAPFLAGVSIRRRGACDAVLLTGRGSSKAHGPMRGFTVEANHSRLRTGMPNCFLAEVVEPTTLTTVHLPLHRQRVVEASHRCTCKYPAANPISNAPPPPSMSRPANTVGLQCTAYQVGLSWTPCIDLFGTA